MSGRGSSVPGWTSRRNSRRCPASTATSGSTSRSASGWARSGRGRSATTRGLRTTAVGAVTFTLALAVATGGLGAEQVPPMERAPILTRSLYLARYTAFCNPHGYLASDPLCEIRPHDIVNELEILAILNSSVTALMLDFSGRYRENRDRTITNQISLDDMVQTLVQDPRKLPEETRAELREAVQPLLHFKQSPDGLRNPRDIKARRKLDEIIFLNALRLNAAEMEDAIDGLSRLISRRLRTNLTSAEIEEGEED